MKSNLQPQSPAAFIPSDPSVPKADSKARKLPEPVRLPAPVSDLGRSSPQRVDPAAQKRSHDDESDEDHVDGPAPKRGKKESKAEPTPAESLVEVYQSCGGSDSFSGEDFGMLVIEELWSKDSEIPPISVEELTGAFAKCEGLFKVHVPIACGEQFARKVAEALGRLDPHVDPDTGMKLPRVVQLDDMESHFGEEGTDDQMLEKAAAVVHGKWPAGVILAYIVDDDQLQYHAHRVEGGKLGAPQATPDLVAYAKDNFLAPG